MGYSRKVGPPIVSAAVATVAVTNFATLLVVKGDAASGLQLFKVIWPILLTSSVATILVMSLLYHTLLELIAELEGREAQAQHQAVHDPLTGLANRALLQEQLGYGLRRLKRNKEKFALLIFDLDKFKVVNDTFGHSAGDLLLRQVGDRLRTIVRDTDTVARVGGDEFAIVQSSIRSHADVRRLCERIIASIGEPFYLGDREVRVGVSVGAIVAHSKTGDASELVRKADITMYQAKAEGRNCYRMFSNNMDVKVQRRNLIEEKLRTALNAGEALQLQYQPQLNPNGKLVAIEGLLRWTDEQLGVLSPAEVIPIAEESGLINRLGEATFRAACRASKERPDLLVAVNLSPLQFRDSDLPTRLRDIAVQQGVQFHQIEIEITESVLIEHADVSESVIRELREIGFRIALDDFGTGYSSLSYLRRFPVDKIKLDQSFFHTGNPGECLRLVAAAVALGHALSLDVVAEGISSSEQEEIAISAGCDALQGYLYAPALPLALIDNFHPLKFGRPRAA